MTETVDQLSLELVAELEAGESEDRAAAYVDPRSIPARHSLLKQMALSAAHYEFACQQPQDDSLAARLASLAPQGLKRSDALRFGAGCHFLLLGEGHKVGRYEGRRAGKAWVEFQKVAADRGCVEILSASEHAKATGVIDSVRRHKEAMRLLFDGTIVESRIDWSWLGKAVRSTPDARNRSWLADLKTTVSAEPRAFVRQGLRLHYHCQIALYLTALEAIGEPVDPHHAYDIAVEKTPPYPVTIFRFHTDAIEAGHKLCRLWMEMLLEAEASGEYPAYSESPVDFELPNYGEPFEIEVDGKRVSV